MELSTADETVESCCCKIKLKKFVINLNYEVDILARPVEHILQAGPEDRNIFKQLFGACNVWVKCPQDELKIFNDIESGLYDMLIILDDILDGTVLRKGLPSAHLVYGIPLTVHATEHKMFLIMKNILCCAKIREDIAINDFITLGIRFFTGQGLEIYYRDIQQCSRFYNFCNGETPVVEYATAFVWGLLWLKLCAKNDKIELSVDFCDKIGEFLQIYDDYINLHSPKYATVRIFSDDLDEGKFNFPVIHAIHTHPNDHRILNMLKKRPLDVESKKLFVEIMESFGSFEYTRKVLEELKNGILVDVDNMNVGKNLYLERVLHDVLDNLETEIYYDGCD
ncbi:terpene synthase-like [Zophobas morio]|uniref:terpene synthase-like n=1 Tax=Zophobas morio TaxID=2755281 RepID=UPI0030835146